MSGQCNGFTAFLEKESPGHMHTWCYLLLLSHSYLLLSLINRPLPRDGGMAEDHGAPEAGQLSRALT